MSKHIWLPTSEMKVQVTQEGQLTVWEDMTMELKPIKKPAGFPRDPGKPSP